MEDTGKKIAALNDAFRKSGGIGGRVVLTTGVQALGQKALNEVIAKIRAFEDFTEGNNPYGERDFGAIVVGGTKIFWKIEYYDKAMEYGSESVSKAPWPLEAPCRDSTCCG